MHKTGFGLVVAFWFSFCKAFRFGLLILKNHLDLNQQTNKVCSDLEFKVDLVSLLKISQLFLSSSVISKMFLEKEAYFLQLP